MQILRLFILSCSHIALSLRQVKSTNRPRPAGFSQKFSARFRKGHPLPCKLARGVRQAFGGSQNLPRGVRHVFGGSQKLPRGVRHVFGGTQKLPRGARSFSGGRKSSAGSAASFRGVTKVFFYKKTGTKAGKKIWVQLKPNASLSGRKPAPFGVVTWRRDIVLPR